MADNTTALTIPADVVESALASISDARDRIAETYGATADGTFELTIEDEASEPTSIAATFAPAPTTWEQFIELIEEHIANLSAITEEEEIGVAENILTRHQIVHTRSYIQAAAGVIDEHLVTNGESPNSTPEFEELLVSIDTSERLAGAIDVLYADVDILLDPEEDEEQYWGAVNALEHLDTRFAESLVESIWLAPDAFRSLTAA